MRYEELKKDDIGWIVKADDKGEYEFMRVLLECLCNEKRICVNSEGILKVLPEQASPSSPLCEGYSIASNLE